MSPGTVYLNPEHGTWIAELAAAGTAPRMGDQLRSTGSHVDRAAARLPGGRAMAGP